MSQKTANLYVRIEPEIKKQAEDILSSLGLTSSNAIKMYYIHIIMHKGIPFDISLPSPRLDLSKMTEKELVNEIKKGLKDVKKGKTKPANEVFDEILKEYEKI